MIFQAIMLKASRKKNWFQNHCLPQTAANDDSF
jgi:hypothetical protein